MNLALLPAEALLALYRRGEATPVDALEAVSLRILRHNPTLNAFAAMNPHAPEEARASARRWAAGRPMGLLDGVPVTVKDLVDVAGLPTRRGSRLTPDTPSAEDAPLVVGLRAAGAVLIGKTTTTEFGWKTPGDSPLHGITRNPWDTRLTTGGSSCGAGAAGAACFGPLHVGTDAGGSIRIPAAWCGLVGLKPTFGRIPQWPAGAFSAVACAGPMTRTVRDTALMLSAMAAPDWRDPFCLNGSPRDWRDGIEDGVEGLRVGVIERPGFDAPADAGAVAAVERAAMILARAGAEVSVASLPGLPDVRDVFGRVWGAALARLVSTFPEERRGELDSGLLEVAAANDLSAIGYLDADALRIATAHALARATRRYDLLLCPTVPRGPSGADEPTVDPLRALWTEWAPWTFAFNLSRQPAIAVPLGAGADGMPRSVQLAAAQHRDDLVLRAARVIERAEPVAIAALDPSDGETEPG